MGLDPTSQEHVDSYLTQINRSELCSRVCEGSTRSGIWVVAWWAGNWYWVTFRGDGGSHAELLSVFWAGLRNCPSNKGVLEGIPVILLWWSL